MSADFTTADKLPKAPIAGAPAEAGPEPLVISPGSALVMPEASLEQAKKIWNAYLDMRDAILSDPACYDDIDGSREMNRTGATRLALPFGLSIRQASLDERAVQDATDGSWDYRFVVTVTVSKGDRRVDGIGSCRLSEIPGKMDVSKREHFAMTKAWTRASKRAIADILGGTEA
jgi:hypothetical protein